MGLLLRQNRSWKERSDEAGRERGAQGRHSARSSPAVPSAALHDAGGSTGTCSPSPLAVGSHQLPSPQEAPALPSCT